MCIENVNLVVLMKKTTNMEQKPTTKKVNAKNNFCTAEKT